MSHWYLLRDTKYNVEVTSDVITVNLPEMESMSLNDPVQIFFANRLVRIVALPSKFLFSVLKRCVFWTDTIATGTVYG